MSDQFVGEIRIVGFNYAPTGWAFCDGQVLSTTQNNTMYELLGTTYGGNGVTTFALPDLRNRVPMHPDANYPLGVAGGEDSHTLADPELPSHAHHLQGSMASAKSQAPAGNALATVVRRATYAAGSPSVAMASGSIGPAGNDLPHENRSPFLNINFIISLTGIYPARS